jgi:hypothetical protein
MCHGVIMRWSIANLTWKHVHRRLPPGGGTSLRCVNAQRVEPALCPGRRVFQNAVFKSASKRRHPLDLQPGMQRPFRLRKA